MTGPLGVSSWPSSAGAMRFAYPRSRSSPWNWSTRLRRWVRIRTPPVRDASTKPTAATVLPAPVACSNQKRLPAFGSSGASATSSSSVDSRSSQSCGSSGSSSSSSSSSSPGMPTGARTATAGSATGATASPVLSRSASSAVSVPESASTWWAERTVPSTSLGSSSDRIRSRPSSSDHCRRQWGDGTLAPASSSTSAASSARRRGVPGASALVASSPSGKNGSRANAEARSISSIEGNVAASATGVVSAMNGSEK